MRPLSQLCLPLVILVAVARPSVGQESCIAGSETTVVFYTNGIREQLAEAQASLEALEMAIVEERDTAISTGEQRGF